MLGRPAQDQDAEHKQRQHEPYRRTHHRLLATPSASGHASCC